MTEPIDDAQKPVDAALLRGAIEAQDERERQAGVKCGVPVEESGCDWPDAVAEEVLSLRAEIARLRALSGAVPMLTEEQMVDAIRGAMFNFLGDQGVDDEYAAFIAKAIIEYPRAADTTITEETPHG